MNRRILFQITIGDLALLLGVLLMYAVLYLLNNNIQYFQPWSVPKTILDEQVDFGPYWIYIYLSAYILPVLMFFYLSRHDLHRVYLQHFFVLTSVTNLIFFIMPSTLERPDFVHSGLDSLTNFAFEFLFAADKPFNCFPSTHVSTSLLAALVTWGRPKIFVPLFVLSLLISYSALAIGQHYVIDALGGVMAATLSVWIHARLFNSNSRPVPAIVS